MIYKDVLFQTVLDQIHDGVYFVNRDRRILFWNKAAEQITGYTADEVVGSHCFDAILEHVDDGGARLCKSRCPLVEAMKGERKVSERVYLHHRDGHRVPVHVKAAPVRTEKGEVIGAVEIFSDDSDHRAMEEVLSVCRSQALMDPLTGLANRRFIEQELDRRLDGLNRYGWGFSLFFLDLDHFKAVNDRHGHEGGDRLLTMTARTLQHNLRPSDIPGRWWGEEFVVICPRLDKADLKSAAERLRMLIGNSQFLADTGKIAATVSIGATVARKGDSLDALVRRADELMYQGKVAGRNRVTVGGEVTSYEFRVHGVLKVQDDVQPTRNS